MGLRRESDYKMRGDLPKLEPMSAGGSFLQKGFIRDMRRRVVDQYEQFVKECQLAKNKIKG